MPITWKIAMVILILCLIASIAIGTVRLIELISIRPTCRPPSRRT